MIAKDLTDQVQTYAAVVALRYDAASRSHTVALQTDDAKAASQAPDCPFPVVPLEAELSVNHGVGKIVGDAFESKLKLAPTEVPPVFHMTSEGCKRVAMGLFTFTVDGEAAGFRCVPLASLLRHMPPAWVPAVSSYLSQLYKAASLKFYPHPVPMPAGTVKAVSQAAPIKPVRAAAIEAPTKQQPPKGLQSSNGARPWLPVTLLSGFLGAGKTTLLQHILNNKQGLKCAVIVNDFAAINVDAALVQQRDMLKESDQMVQLENGCICCTLKDDLVNEIATFAASGKFEYLVIESTGISEPVSVADAFKGSVHSDTGKAFDQIARIDTCVTVVDASCVLASMQSVRTVRQQTELVGEGIQSDLDRLVADLLVEQIEFADVIVLNKQDLLAAADQAAVQQLVQSLNPDALVLPTSFSKVDLGLVMNTGRFATGKTGAQMESYDSSAPHDDTAHDAITSFTYTARMPFHPGRLHSFFQSFFILQQEEWPDEQGEEEEGDAAGGHQRSQPAGSGDKDAKAAAPNGAVDKGAGAHEAKPLDVEEASRKQAQRTAAFGMLLRSKGFAWVAGDERGDHCAEWSGAGNVLRFGTGGPWFAALPVDLWPEDKSLWPDILGKFQPGAGDRRQELVFIGIDMDEAALRACLDACLATHEELIVGQDLADPFVPWPALYDEESDEEGSDDEDGDEGDDEDDAGGQKAASGGTERKRKGATDRGAAGKRSRAA